jgi:hypothetical protein
MFNMMSWLTTIWYIVMTHMTTVKSTGWVMMYEPVSWLPAVMGIMGGTTIAWPSTVIPRWAMSMRRWRSQLHWDHNSVLAFMAGWLWQTTCVAAKA